MKKFNYSMDNILKIKIKMEDQARIAYGNARLRLTEEEKKLVQMEMKKKAYSEELRSLRTDRLDLLKIKRCEEAVEIVAVNIQQQAVIVKNAAHRLEVARIRLNDAMIERKIQEKLKESAWQNYMQEVEAEEQKEIDELNSFHYSNPTLDEEDR